jgi:RNA polymerase sigma-70 factor (ECF subfamily)
MTDSGPSRSPEVAAALVRARESWPRLRFDEERLVARLAAAGASLEKLDVAGLALAQACLEGDSEAIEEFERSFMSEVGVALKRLGATRDESDEIRQRMRLDLFVPAGGKRSKLDYFSGKGTLRGWLRAVVGQEYAGLKRQPKLEPVESLTEWFFTGATGPDLAWTRAECRQHFREALELAIRGLPERERTALKLSAIDGLSIDELARVFQAHRSTAARWLVRARESIAAGVRAHLAQKLGLETEELDSLVRAVGSESPVTLERLLGGPG